jgi:hypothetical protein
MDIIGCCYGIVKPTFSFLLYAVIHSTDTYSSKRKQFMVKNKNFKVCDGIQVQNIHPTYLEKSSVG